MFSLESNEFMIFLSNYFNIKPEIILQKSIENQIIALTDTENIVISKLKSLLGYQRRLLEPLSVGPTKSSPFDTIVFLHSYKNFDNHYSFLIADQSNIFKLIVFKKDHDNPTFKKGITLKIESCYYKEGKLLTNVLPKNIWFVEFSHVFFVREYYLDNLPECIYDEEYSKITNLVNILGYFLIIIVSDKLFCYIHSKTLQIRLIPYKIEELNHSFSTKLVRISYCELEYGPDAYQLKMSEFSEFSLLSSIPVIFNSSQFKELIRFEYPTFRMALSELTEKAVACTKIKLLTFERTETCWNFYGYDSSQAVCLTIFDNQFAEFLSLLIFESSTLLIDGIYKRGKNYYLRERVNNIQKLDLEEDDDVIIPVTNPELVTEEKLTILDIYITEVFEKTFLNKDNRPQRYEKIKGITNNLKIMIHNYNDRSFQKLLVGKSYRLFFVKSRFFSENLYFTMSIKTIISNLE